MGGQQSWVKRWGRTRGCITGVRLLFWTFSIKNPLETLSQCAEVHGSKMALSLSLKAKTSFYALIKKLKTVAYFMSRIFSNDFNCVTAKSVSIYVFVAARYCTYNNSMMIEHHKVTKTISALSTSDNCVLIYSKHLNGIGVFMGYNSHESLTTSGLCVILCLLIVNTCLMSCHFTHRKKWQKTLIEITIKSRRR